MDAWISPKEVCPESIRNFMDTAHAGPRFQEPG
jgi:hypothetical protein